jgi:hypothetical protein
MQQFHGKIALQERGVFSMLSVELAGELVRERSQLQATTVKT